MKSAIKPTPIKDPSRLEALKDILLNAAEKGEAAPTP